MLICNTHSFLIKLYPVDNISCSFLTAFGFESLSLPPKVHHETIFCYHDYIIA